MSLKIRHSSDFMHWLKHPLLILFCVIIFYDFTESQITLEFTLTEECPLHTFVGNLNGVPMSSSTVAYTLSTFQLLTQTNQFVLNETSGDLFTRSRIDREQLCPQKQPQLHHQHSSPSLDLTARLELDKFSNSASGDVSGGSTLESLCRVQLQALQFTQKLSTDTDPMTHHVIIVKIIILDINDNPPGWQESVIHLSIPEHSPIGTRLPLPEAFDPDCGPINTTMTYLLRDMTTDDRGSHVPLVQHGYEVFQLDTEFVPGADTTELGHTNIPNLWLGGGCNRRAFRLWLRVARDFDYDDPAVKGQIPQTMSRIDDTFTSNSLHLKNVRLQLVAADGGQPISLTGNLLINVTIMDINDHPPIFQVATVKHLGKDFSVHGTIESPKQEQIEIEENMPVGRCIYVARATDVDLVDIGQLQYKLETSASLPVRKMFDVNGRTGEVILLQSPDYERQRLYTVPLSVTDGKHTSSLNLFVKIKNQNDHPPVITIRPIGQHKDDIVTKSGVMQPHASGSQSTSSQVLQPKAITLYVSEHDLPGRFIATVTITDVDDIPVTDGQDFGETNNPTANYGLSGLHIDTSDSSNAGVHCKLSHAGLTLQPLFEGALNQFKLITQGSFDREQQTEQFTTLTCLDRGHPPLSAQIGIHLVIEDINDHGPAFKHSPMIAHLKENEPIGTKVFTVEAHDPDVGVNAQLGFAIDDSNTNDFMIDSRSGVISSLRSFDREQREYFNLTVIVRDMVTSPPGTTAAESNTMRMATTDVKVKSHHEKEHKVTGHVLVYIQDVNDCPPLFPNSLYQLSVSEDAKINFLIGQINASDADATDANSQIHYVIQQQADNQAMQEFRVSPKGYIYVARGNLDREKISSYNFHLIAIDSGVPPLSSTTQVHIYITDVNDNAPTWHFPAHNNQVVNLTLSEPVGYRVAQLNAVDPDEGENGEVTYRLVQTNVIALREELERSALLGQKNAVETGSFGAYNTADGNYARPNTLNRLAAGNLFELDPSSGSIYVGRSMGLDDIGSVKLVVEARDHGKPPRVNHRVLQVNIFRFSTQPNVFNTNGMDELGLLGTDKGRYRSQPSAGGGQIENDLIVIVIMVAVTLIISLALIVAILFLRCGVCPSRNIVQYNSGTLQNYRHNVSATHHLEEVFRDSGGTMDADGLTPNALDSLNNCNQLSDATLTTYQGHAETEPMFRSYMSTHGTGGNDSWMLTTLSPKKSAPGCETLTCPRGNITCVQSPYVRDENNKLVNTVGTERRIKRPDDGTLNSSSMIDSPEHEMHLLVTKRATPAGKHSTIPCSTFRASCSHLTGGRSNAPCRTAGKLTLGLLKDSQVSNETVDIDSMDSGHGHSLDNGASSSYDPLSQRAKSSNQVTTFRCYTPGSCPDRKAFARKFSTDLDNGEFNQLKEVNLCKTRSGTLPFSFTLDKPLAKIEDVDKTPAEPACVDAIKSSSSLLKSNSSHITRARQSVTWLDPTYQLCGLNQEDRVGSCENDTEVYEHSSSCQFARHGEIPESVERGDTLVLLNPVDRLGYAQLVHSGPNGAVLCDRGSPAQNTYSSFPTSFV